MSLHDLTQRFPIQLLTPQDAALPATVAAALPAQDVRVFACEDAYSDTAAFSAHYGFGLADCANTLIVKYPHQQADHYAAVVSLGSLRLDLNGAVRHTLGTRKVSMARREVATELTGMAFGGITAFGLPAGLRILVDAAVMDREFVVMGAGRREAKLLLAPPVLRQLPGVEVASLTLPAE